MLVFGALSRTYGEGSLGWWFWTVLFFIWVAILVLKGLVWILERRAA
jgi:hypothetical protein